MINLSQTAFRSRDIGLGDKLSLLVNPEIFFAENIKDFNTAAARLRRPWYMLGSSTIYVTVHNVRLELIDRCSGFEYFLVRDRTGQRIMGWRPSRFASAHSYEEVCATQALLPNDRVYRLFFRYHLDQKMAEIVEVQKHTIARPSGGKKKFFPDGIRKTFPEMKFSQSITSCRPFATGGFFIAPMCATTYSGHFQEVAFGENKKGFCFVWRRMRLPYHRRRGNQPGDEASAAYDPRA